MKILVIGADFAMYACLVRILKNHDLIAVDFPEKKIESNEIPELSRHEIGILRNKYRAIFAELPVLNKNPPPNPSICAKNCRKLKTKGRTKGKPVKVVLVFSLEKFWKK